MKDHDHTSFSTIKQQQPAATTSPQPAETSGCIALPYCGQKGKTGRSSADCLRCMDAYYRHQIEQLEVALKTALLDTQLLVPERRALIEARLRRLHLVREVKVTL